MSDSQRASLTHSTNPASNVAGLLEPPTKVEAFIRASMANNRGAWTPEEDQRLAQVIETQGPKRWKSIATKAGLNRCGKSCRLRWMNYLRPNIKRGNISAQEEDLILRLHKLLGNRWSLISGRLPGRTDNEIKNYWNSHLSKKAKQIQLNKHSVTNQGNTNTASAAKTLETDKLAKDNFVEQSVVIKHEAASNEMVAPCSNAKSRTGEQINENGQEQDGLNMEWVSQLLGHDMNDQIWLLNYF
ncbi:unnamed protein product [Rhodiola kirilowii]